jgi:hypothetical protein
MGNKTSTTKTTGTPNHRPSNATATPQLSTLTQEIITELQSRSRTRADTCLLRTAHVLEKIQTLNALSNKCAKDVKALDLKSSMPDIHFNSTMQDLLALLDSVESCRCKIPKAHRPPPFKLR